MRGSKSASNSATSDGIPDRPREIVLEYLRRIGERTRATQLDVEELKSLTSILRNDIVNVKRALR